MNSYRKMIYVDIMFKSLIEHVSKAENRRLAMNI